MYTSKISAIRFSPASTATVQTSSALMVIKTDTYNDGKPAQGGPFDARLGTTDYSYKCDSCLHSFRKCLGHFGHVNLTYPVFAPLLINEVKRWLRIVCYYCGRLPYAREKYTLFPRNSRFVQASKAHRNANHPCVHCGQVLPAIKAEPDSKLFLTISVMIDEKMRPITLLPHVIGEIFDRILPEDVAFLGRHVHPSDLILRSVVIPSASLRPDPKKNEKTSADVNLMPMINYIITNNVKIGSLTAGQLSDGIAGMATMSPYVRNEIMMFVETYTNYVCATNTEQFQSLVSLLKTKKGFLRMNVLGRRVHNMARSTIIGNPRLGVDQVGVPLHFAQRIPVEETVQDYNRARLMTYVQNGRDIYPGALSIRKPDGKVYAIEVAKNVPIENGDIVMRNMLSGDIKMFNRQPTLTAMSASGHTAIIPPDPENRTLQMNVQTCKQYAADFDGDQMTLIIPTSVASRVEVELLGALSTTFISPNTSSPTVGCCNDSIIGLWALSREGVRYSRYKAGLLFANTNLIPDLSAVGPEGISGRDIISIVLADTPITFRRASSWYNPTYAPFLKYNERDSVVEIREGRLLRGVLDASTLSAESNGNIFHMSAREYSAAAALSVMHSLQQLAIGHLMFECVSTGYRDLLLPPVATEQAKRIVRHDMILASKINSEQLRRGELIPPIGYSTEEFYEAQQIEILRTPGQFDEITLGGAGIENHLVQLIGSGTKGKIAHFTNMTSAIGQRTINEKRMPQKFGYCRTGPYTRIFDMSPKSRGFITSSYLTGINDVIEFFHAAKEARLSLITKALMTAKGGTQNRHGIMNLQSHVVSNTRSVVIHKFKIVQFLYGDDGIDPRHHIRVHFPSVECSNEAFLAGWGAGPDAGPHARRLAELTRTDRDWFRKWALRMEGFNAQGSQMSATRMQPIMVEQVMAGLSTPPPGKMTAEMIEAGCAAIIELREQLPYLFMNETHWTGRKAEGALTPTPWMVTGTRLLGFQIFTFAGVRAVEAGLVGERCLEFCRTIRFLFLRSLIAPGAKMGIIAAQAVSEPLIQALLSATHGSAARGANGPAVGGAVTAEELFSARPLSKLRTARMRIALRPDIETGGKGRDFATTLASEVELTKMSDFTRRWAVFFETPGSPIHPEYLDEAADWQEWCRLHPLLPRPADLSFWTIRIELNRAELLLKSMTMDHLASRLRALFGDDCYIMYTPENRVDKCYLRFVPRAMLVQGSGTTELAQSNSARMAVLAIKDRILETPLRGITGLWGAKPGRIIRSEINAAGAISLVKRETPAEAWAVDVNGISYLRAAALPEVDGTRMLISSVEESANVFGIHNARQSLLVQLRNLVSKPTYCHLLTYAAEMTRTGRFTAIDGRGVKIRDPTNTLARIGYNNPRAALQESVAAAIRAPVECMISELIAGGSLGHGTLFNNIGIREDYVRSNVTGVDTYLDVL